MKMSSAGSSFRRSYNSWTRGARQGPSNKHGGTPISAAVYCAAHFNSGGNYARVVRSLLAAGGQVPPQSLELALEHHLDDIVEVLKEHGASL
jgi:hypothetical protein